MARIDQNVEVYSTEDKDLNFFVDTGDGVTAQDITGATIFWKLAKHPASTALITKSGSIIPPATGGRFKVSVVAADWAALDGVFYHEARIVDGSANDTVVASGTLVVNKGLA